MVLAAHGTHIAESTLESQAGMTPGGTDIEQLEGLARRFGVAAQIQHATVDDLRTILAQGKLPIAYINRAFFDLASLRHVRPAFLKPLQHAVIPICVSAHFVTFQDPLVAGIVRRSRARFDRAHAFLRYVTLVCEGPEIA